MQQDNKNYVATAKETAVVTSEELNSIKRDQNLTKLYNFVKNESKTGQHTK